MSDVEIYKMAGWLGDTKTIFKLFEDNNTPELDFYMFLEDLSWHYVENQPMSPLNDINYHLLCILGQELSFVLRCMR